MTGGRGAHALAQFDPRHTMGYWAGSGPTVRLPWWLAIPSYPVVIGTRVLVWAGQIPFQALRNYVSWRRPSTDVVPSDVPYILLLRTFGGDGGLLMSPPPALPNSVASSMTRSITLEQILGKAAEDLGMSLVGFADHDITSFPPGVRYHKVEHRTWRAQFESLADSAAAIVAMSTPGRHPGSAFRGELEYLMSQGLAPKAVVVAPPDLDEDTRAANNLIYSTLAWPQVKHGYLTAHMGDDGRLNLRPTWGREDAYLAGRYAEAFEWALGDVLRRS